MSFHDRPGPDELAAAASHYDGTVRRGRTLRRRRMGVLAGAAVIIASVGIAVPVLASAGPGRTQRVIVVSPPSPSTALPSPSVPATTVPAGPLTTPTAPTAPPSTAPSTTSLTAPSTTSSATATADLEVVACPTTLGFAANPTSLPTSMAVQVPPALAPTVALYADQLGIMKVLAPKGWKCAAIDAADGSASVAAYPPGQTLPPTWSGGWPLSASSPVQAVVGGETSACSGCTDGQACPLFTAAATAFQSQFGRPCPATRPAGEVVQRINPALVAFEDPPGVAGDGNPSGGVNPANGVMTYIPGDVQGSWVDTCTLPEADKSVCTTALNTWISWYGQR